MEKFTELLINSSYDPTKLILSLVGGFIPAMLWLMFWLREDKERPEPKGLIFLTLLAGMIAVIPVLPLQRLASQYITDQNNLLPVLVAIEEVMKFSAVSIIIFRNKFLDEPVDYALYFIVGALGFATLENALFLTYPINIGDTTVSVLTGNLRFLGATLLHAMTTGFVGCMLGLAFFKSNKMKFFYILGGLGVGIVLHTTFNFFIIKNNGGDVLTVFGFLWVFAVIIMLLFEKLRRMSEPLYITDRASIII